MTVDYFAADIDPNAVIEPWTPKVGDRVRVALNGECQHLRERTSLKHGPIGILCGHQDGEHGRIGTVCIDPLPANFDYGNHRYLVMFDKPWEHDNGFHRARMTGAHYAACELERLTDEVQP